MRLPKQLTGTLWAARRLLPGYGLDDPAFTLDIHARAFAAIMSRAPQAVAQVMDEHLAHLEHAWQLETTRTALRPRPWKRSPIMTEDPRPAERLVVVVREDLPARPVTNAAAVLGVT